MSYAVRWSSRALERMASILDYIAEDNPDAALSMIDRIEDRVAGLGVTPGMGSHYLRSKVGGLRQLIERPYRIVYLVDDKRQVIHVVAVQHMREDVQAADEILEGGDK